MAISDEDDRPIPPPQAIGEDLATVSEDELEERIVILQREIERVQAALEARRASRQEASSFFKI